MGLTHYKPEWARILAVAACMAVLTGTVVDYNKAGRVLTVQLGYFQNKFPDQPIEIRETKAQFCRRWWCHFEERGNVHDAPRTGRPPKVSDADALKAAQIITAGYNATCMAYGRQTVEHKYFGTIADAVAHSDTLQEILRNSRATNQQLREAIHRVSPDVVHRRVSFKHRLTDAEKAKRMVVCTDLLSRHHHDRTLLHKMVFIDETTIMTHGLKSAHVHVWVNSSDPNFHDYHTVPGKAYRPAKVHVIAAVTAHPQYEPSAGVVYVEFTTGTTKIHRRHNLRLDGSTRVPNFKYTVSVLPAVDVHGAACEGCESEIG